MVVVANRMLRLSGCLHTDVGCEEIYERDGNDGEDEVCGPDVRSEVGSLGRGCGAGWPGAARGAGVDYVRSNRGAAAGASDHRACVQSGCAASHDVLLR